MKRPEEKDYFEYRGNTPNGNFENFVNDLQAYIDFILNQNKELKKEISRLNVNFYIRNPLFKPKK